MSERVDPLAVKPAATIEDVFALLPAKPEGVWSYVIANKLNLRGAHQPITTRAVVALLHKLERRGRASRHGRTGSLLYLGWCRL